MAVGGGGGGDGGGGDGGGGGGGGGDGGVIASYIPAPRLPVSATHLITDKQRMAQCQLSSMLTHCTIYIKDSELGREGERESKEKDHEKEKRSEKNRKRKNKFLSFGVFIFICIFFFKLQFLPDRFTRITFHRQSCTNSGDLRPQTGGG